MNKRNSHIPTCFIYDMDFPTGSVVNNPTANSRRTVSIPGLGRSPGEGNGNPLQYSCLENSMDRGAWQAPVQVWQSQTRLSDYHLLVIIKQHTNTHPHISKKTHYIIYQGIFNYYNFLIDYSRWESVKTIV